MHPQAILVGTGNNFAPEYGARFDSNHRPIARVQPKGTPASTWVRTNTAVDFFATRSYAAITPGQYDFYFGAEFLRQTGSVLPLLGANLMITTAKQQTEQQPLCAPAQLLLPNQVSLPVQSGSGQSGGKGKAGGQSARPRNCCCLISRHYTLDLSKRLLNLPSSLTMPAIQD
jgi:hypothetical protein